MSEGKPESLYHLRESDSLILQSHVLLFCPRNFEGSALEHRATDANRSYAQTSLPLVDWWRLSSEQQRWFKAQFVVAAEKWVKGVDTVDAGDYNVTQAITE